MTAYDFGVLIGILFIALAWLHYRVNKLNDRLHDFSKDLKATQTTTSLTYFMIVGLTELLLDKGVITEEDLNAPTKSKNIS